MSNRTVVVDTAIAGEIIRVIVQSPLALRAANANQALEELRAEHEDFRRFVVEPPHGHADLNAVLLLPAYSDKATRTIVVTSQFGYVPLAGTPLLASGAVAVFRKLVTPCAQTAEVQFDTALGLQSVEVLDAEDATYTARWRTVAPTVLVFDHALDMGCAAPVPVALIDAGLPYVVAREASLDLSLGDLDALGDAGRRLSAAAARSLPMAHFGLAERSAEYPALIVGDAEPDAAGCAEVPMAWLYPDGRVARMPAGTGALATAAFVHAAGSCAASTRVIACSPFGETIRSQLDDGEGRALVEADVEIKSTSVLT